MPGKRILIIISLILVLAVLIFFAFRTERSERATKGVVTSEVKTSEAGSDKAISQPADQVLAPNAEPVITGVKLEFESSADKDLLRATARGNAAEGKTLTFSYKWTKNGEPAGEGDSISGYKRGDMLAVTIIPFDGEKYGLHRISTTEISNTTPKIRSINEIPGDKNTVIYKVDAFDPDGDTLTFSLLDAPAGVTIDGQGIIKWTFEKADETISFKVKITDGNGGEATQPVTLNSGKPEPPKAEPPKAVPPVKAEPAKP
jgi:hypothetical protein